MERGNAVLRFFDETLGPEIIRILSLFRRRRVRPTAFNRIGLIKTAAIGDTILVSALIDDLREANPNSHIVLFTGASNFAFANLLKRVDQVVQLPLKKPFASRRLLRAQNLDVCIDAESWPRISALFAWLSGAYTIGFETAGQRRHSLFDRVVHHDPRVHELENYRHLLSALGIKTSHSPQNLAGPWAPSSSLILFHLWPGGRKSHLREWPLPFWGELASALLTDPSLKIALTGGREDRDHNEAFLATLDSTVRSRVENVAGQSFPSLLEMIRTSKLVVCVNTGIMHLAAAIGAPTIGLHGPTNPARWGPIGDQVVALLSSTHGAGFLNLGFEYDGQPEVMAGLAVADVEREAKRLLALSAR